MSPVLAELDDFSVAYRFEGTEIDALSAITLGLVAGERLAVIGESGSGKSTLALALASLLPANAVVRGGLAWPGLATKPLAGRDIGFVFQDAGASLNPVLRVGEQIAEVARRHRGQGWAEAYATAETLLARVRLPEPGQAMRAFPHQLSGGQRQRVAIAAAIAGGPKLLIADEPTSALDTIVQAEIVALLDALVRKEGMTLLFITHDIALASGFADRIAVFNRGRMVEAGPTNSLLANPVDAYTKRLIASQIDLTTTPLIAGVA